MPRGDPRRDALEKRKALHAALNKYIDARGGWLTSVCGDPLMRFEALPGSDLPDDLRAKGYIIDQIGTTTRILPAGNTEVMSTTRVGALELATEGSTRPRLLVHHAGIQQTHVYELLVTSGIKSSDVKATGQST
jgi:hypothetical protein